MATPTNVYLDLAISIAGIYEATGQAFTQTAQHKVNAAVSENFQTGTTANKANRVYVGSGSVTSTPTDIDLAGGSLSDQLGNTLTFVEVCVLMIVNNNTTDGENLLVGGDANSIPFFGAVGDYLIVKAEGGLCLWSPLATGYVVTAGTGDILQLASASAGYNISYSLILVGRDA